MELLCLNTRSSTLSMILIFLTASIVCAAELCGNTWVNISQHEDAIKLESPNFPLFYPDSTDCVWNVQSSERGSFAIHFLKFDTEPETDLLFFGRGPKKTSDSVLYQVSSFVPSHIVAVIEETQLWILFHSNYGVASSGFQLQIERINEAA
ncbi:low-density lipoprotein receptor-related protein 3-like [Amphiura filiformis]|uniref:low-density lipoprotein receptor-related protein 3-like n=1 Tax=Amphiura filiformis TaxID=82378 RepID=UPI003B221D92